MFSFLAILYISAIIMSDDRAYILAGLLMFAMTIHLLLDKN